MKKKRNRLNYKVVLFLGIGFLAVLKIYWLSSGNPSVEPPTSNSEPIQLPIKPVITKTTSVEPIPKDDISQKEKFDRPANDRAGNPTIITATKPAKEIARKKMPVTKERLIALKTPEEIDSFLEDVRIDDLSDPLRAADIIGKPERPDPNLSHFDGHFSGKVRFFDNLQQIWDMAMDASTRVEDSKMHADIKIRLSENGQVIKNINGSLDAGYRNIDTMGLILAVATSPSRLNEVYFQLFYVPNLDAFIGNYYDQTTGTKKEPKGTVRLDRNNSATENNDA